MICYYYDFLCPTDIACLISMLLSLIVNIMLFAVINTSSSCNLSSITGQHTQPDSVIY